MSTTQKTPHACSCGQQDATNAAPVGSGTVLLDAQGMESVLDALAAHVITQHGDCRTLALIGIQRRGVIIAKRLQERMERTLGAPVPFGTLDINLYRDDWTTLSATPAIGKTSIPFEVEGKTLLLVDDVLFTGRTIRAALEALVDFGRPGKVELLVVVDRGHRELPIHADYIGMTQQTAKKDRVDILVQEFDGADGARLVASKS